MGLLVPPPAPREWFESDEAYKRYLQTDYRDELERLAAQQAPLAAVAIPLSVVVVLVVVVAILWSMKGG